MTVRRTPGEQHADHELERAHVARLARHEDAVREQERARERRRMQPLLPSPVQVEDPDFPGCFFDGDRI